MLQYSKGREIVCVLIIHFTPGPPGREPRALIIAIAMINQSSAGKHSLYTHSYQIIWEKKSILRKNYLAEKFATSTVIKINI